ncbi:methyltransferase domain-containing protein [Candidatus Micrarchaeota archaeon]|nr:methyltransferase domain-containing protein [Candidatus Micrarchaeota archaeon]
MVQHYRLVDGTLEIDGVRMHQTVRKTPLQDAADKVAALRPDEAMAVLDICTGLGYSALSAARRGCWVTTIEKDPHVLALAMQNPDSEGLFDHRRIKIVNEDAYAFVPTLADASFDLILHDPPRFSMAGELYSGAFYSQLFRVLKAGGRLFHYTGTPGSARGKNLPRGVKDRLLAAGFQHVTWVEDLLGFLAEKPLVARTRPPLPF